MADCREGGFRYTHKGRVFPSVTTIIDAAPKPWMEFYVARETALWAVESRGAWLRLAEKGDESAAVKLIKHGPERHRTRAAEIGTAVHLWAEAHATGEELPTVPKQLEAYCRSYLKFVDELGPEPVHTERRVFNRKVGYAGTLDALIDCPEISRLREAEGLEGHGPRILLDYKTGASGIHGTVALQLAALAHGEFMLGESGFGEEPMFEWPDAFYAVHLRPRGYALVKVDVEHPMVWRGFRALAAVRDFMAVEDSLLDFR